MIVRTRYLDLDRRGVRERRLEFTGLDRTACGPHGVGSQNYVVDNSVLFYVALALVKCMPRGETDGNK